MNRIATRIHLLAVFAFACAVVCAEDAEVVPAPPPLLPDAAKPADETKKPAEDPKPPADPPKPEDPTPPKPTEDDPTAETVPLPAERPTGTATVPEGTAQVSGDLDPLMLRTETPVIQPNEAATFSLYGPEAYLRGANGHYALRDEYGRDLVRGVLKVADLPYTEGKPRQIHLPVTQPIAFHHTLVLSLTGLDGKSVELKAPFSVPRTAEWKSWITLLSSPPPAGTWNALRDIGIRGGVQYRMHPARREALRKASAPFYVENIARQMLSKYHTEKGLWEKTIAAMAEPESATRFQRSPSLSSVEFAEAFAREVKRHAEFYAKDPPLFYSLASEPSTTRLAAAADFDFSPAAIAEFQRFLERDVYGTLTALNASWGTQFKSWQEVMPMTTDEARMRLKDGVFVFGPWVDFREFQDHALDSVLRGGADIIRQSDKTAKIGITGAMGPFAFGGWDWSRLSKTLDVVECYDIGGARALWRDLAPGKPALATLPLWESARTEEFLNDARRNLWSFALEGGLRGAVVWDEGGGGDAPGRGLLDGEGRPAPIAQGLAGIFRPLEGETGLLLSHSTRVDDGVAVLYSPASVRLHWLLEAERLHGDKWLQAWGADSAGERRESPQLRLRESWSKLLDDMGLAWRYVSSQQIESKIILKPESSIRTIVLPRAIALSDQEVDVLKQFVQNGGRLVADACCGRFDNHGRMRAKPPLDEIFGVDTSQEPLAPEPMNPLMTFSKTNCAVAERLDAAEIKSMAPVFSDDPKWTRERNAAAEYRGSPVIAVTKSGAYLNLDLTDYLRWRLHPDQPRAAATRSLLQRLAFAERLDETLIDFKQSTVPPGTQFVWLAAGGARSSRVLALRRNPQERLHELGGEGDGNWPFEKPEAFTLVLRLPQWVQTLDRRAAPERQAVQKIVGELDPHTPSLFVVSNTQPPPFRVTFVPEARPGDTLELKLAREDGKAAPCIFSMRVSGPDGKMLSWYSAAKHVSDGKASFTLPLAASDATGQWQVQVREVISGFEETLNLRVKGPEK